jgi:hypothetical protein
LGQDGVFAPSQGKLTMKEIMGTSIITEHGEESWHQFLKEIRQGQDVLHCGKDHSAEAWFRGVTDSKNHRLLPSLFRSHAKPNSDKSWYEIWDLESDLFYEFAARARELHAASQSDWDILFAMQHYGTPTRLLDWTEALGVAVYFAVVGVDETKLIDENGTAIAPPCIWILNPYRLNAVSTGINPADLWSPEMLGWDEGEKTYYTYGELLLEAGMYFDAPRAIYPRQRNPRLHAQRAWFTIHGDEYEPLETMSKSASYLKKVILPFSAIPSARQFLEDAGIDHYLLFSDLESLSRNLREKHGLITSKKAGAEVRRRLEDRR